MELGVFVVISSDAHFSGNVGNFTEAMRMLNEIDFPEALVANTTLDKFCPSCASASWSAGFEFKTIFIYKEYRRKKTCT